MSTTPDLEHMLHVVIVGQYGDEDSDPLLGGAHPAICGEAAEPYRQAIVLADDFGQVCHEHGGSYPLHGTHLYSLPSVVACMTHILPTEDGEPLPTIVLIDNWDGGLTSVRFVVRVDGYLMPLCGRVVVDTAGYRCDRMGFADVLRAEAGLKLARDATDAELLRMHCSAVHTGGYLVRAAPTAETPTPLTNLTRAPEWYGEGFDGLRTATACTAFGAWMPFEPGVLPPGGPLFVDTLHTVLDRGPMVALDILRNIHDALGDDRRKSWSTTPAGTYRPTIKLAPPICDLD